ncbi:MAG TPA: HAMP domain-containing sensor histidine kinase [Planctomycetaceae bacterium]|nr:HAMP domain-containing sensor histidine kinase [Planctomycetaceae bacterium]
MASADDAQSQDSTTAWLPSPERLEVLAEFAAGAGHEINNPLATIIGRAQQLLRDETNPQRRQSLAIIATQAYRVRDMIGDVMTFARPPTPQRSVFDAAAQIRTIAERLQEPLTAGSCELAVTGSSAARIDADSSQFAVVISELIRNAITALQPDGGTITVTVSTAERGVEVAVTDHGKGFTSTEREHAFDPFFSGRQAGRGLGFGLCKAARIVHLHGGAVLIHSPPGGPTTITTQWPSV